MKKFFAGLAALVLSAGLVAACSGPDGTGGTDPSADGDAGSGGGVDIGYALPDTTNPFLGWLSTEVQALAEADGLTVQIADAGLNSSTQISQLENFISMEVAVIGVLPVDPTAVGDVLQRARDAGIKVFVQGTDTGVWDVMENIDQEGSGAEAATMGVEWMTTTFSSDGTEAGLPDGLKALVIKYTGTIDAAARTQGIIDTLEGWGHAEVVVAQAEATSAADARSIMENMWQQNSDANLIVCYNADAALGVNEYLMGQPGLDRSRMAVFSVDASDPVNQVIAQSATNDSVFRGTIGILGPEIDGELVELPTSTYAVMKGLTEGELVYGDTIIDAVGRVTPETLAEQAAAG